MLHSHSNLVIISEVKNSWNTLPFSYYHDGANAVAVPGVDAIFREIINPQLFAVASFKQMGNNSLSKVSTYFIVSRSGQN